MTIYRDDNEIKKEKVSSWLDEFAKYWEKAEGRIKKADYLSEIQRTIINKGKTVDDVVSDLKERVGLNKIEEMKKESDSSSADKKASFSDAPQRLRDNEELLVSIISKINSNPYISFEGLQNFFNYPKELEHEDAIEYVRKFIQDRREGLPKEKATNNYVGDFVDTLDNRDITPGQGNDGVNKI